MAPMRSILVTGAAGFVGRHLLTHLQGAFPDAVLAAGPFDVRDAAAVRAAVAASRPQACVHLAAIAAIQAARADAQTAWQVNLQGTLCLARTLLELAPDCTLVFASTADAYGSSFQSGLPATEATPLAPMNTYAATKAAADLALGAMVVEGLRVIRVRAFNHTGRGQSNAFVVAAFAEQIARIAAGLQPAVMRVGALEVWRDFLDVRDVCRAYGLCIARAEAIPAGQVFNIASGVPRRIGDILAAMLEMAGVEAAIEVDPGRLRRADIALAVGDASAARSVLGWSPAVAWETTLADILQDWRGRIGAG